MNLYEKIEEALEERDVNSKSQIITIAVNMTIEAIKDRARLEENPIVNDTEDGLLDGSYYLIYRGEIDRLTE